MATSRHFRHNVRTEQELYEDLIIESIRFYGQDVWYIPREVVKTNDILQDEALSRFEYAYKIEVYIDNIEGFDGEGDLFAKFGVEIRDAATFVVARRRFSQDIGLHASTPEKKYYRPREGDLIHLPMSDTTFQIMNVETENPFYQLGQLPVFKMRCEMFEYSGEDFDTFVPGLDQIEAEAAYQYVLQLDSAANGFEIGEIVAQDHGDFVITGEVVRFSDSDNKLYLAHVGSTDGLYREFSPAYQLVGNDNGSIVGLVSYEEKQNIQNTAPDFDVEALEFVDFSESNPFGDPI